MDGKENAAFQSDGEQQDSDPAREQDGVHLRITNNGTSKDSSSLAADPARDQLELEGSPGHEGVGRGNPVSRQLADCWRSLARLRRRHKRALAGLLVVLLNCLLVAFLAAAVAHHVLQGSEDIDWCNGLGILIIMVSLLYLSMFYYLVVKRQFGATLARVALQPCGRVWDKVWGITLVRMLVYCALLASLIIFLVLDTADNRERLISFLGLVVLLLIGFLFSKHPDQIVWRPVFWGLALQFVFGLLTIRWVVGRLIFQCVGDHVTTFLLYTNNGSSFVFGDFLVIQQGLFAFQVMPVIFFFCFCVQILYYYGAMQAIVIKLGWLLQKSMGTTVAESVNASASVFLGMSEAPLLIQTYLKDLTRSEMHAIMTGGFSTVAGTVLAAYISFGVEPAHLITASVMSAPAALCYAKLFYPETEQSRNRVEQIVVTKDDSTSVLDAAVKGVTAGIQIVLGIVANIIAFLAFVAFLDGVLGWAGRLVGIPDVTFVNILGYIFVPLAWVMGVQWSECQNVAQLIGLKTIVNEFVAYQRLGEMKKNGLLSARSEAIATYALCGFSNPGSVGILMGSLITLAPSKRPEITGVAYRAFFAGSAVCFMTACIAGILLTEDHYSTNNYQSNVSATSLH
ncbi:uncharacterized transporter YutK-like [Bacillus rossius redtenbacheri]|uniref:uncharacterized transporter YutK-like n=1 Tax=Bacillus rossius redtenbacheri TaxID=93214 RepID=UPI002FDE5735